MNLHGYTQNTNIPIFVGEPFEDHRGNYTETYNQSVVFNVAHDWSWYYTAYANQINSLYAGFIQDDAIKSYKNVFRGYHGDDKTWKFITCLHGTFEITVVCIDPTNPHFMKNDTLFLTDINKLSILLPPKFVNGHLCTSDTCVFFYKQTSYYRGENHQYSIRMDSIIPSYAWETKTPILSERDSTRAKRVDDYIVNGILVSPEEINR